MSERDDSVGIVGAGPFGTALAHLVAGAGRRAILWSQTAEVVDEINRARTNVGRLPGIELADKVEATGDPAELAARARFVVLAVSSEEARGRLRSLGDCLDGGHIVVHAIGGFAVPGDLRVSEVACEETPVLRVGALAGPALPDDLASARASSMVCASAFSEVTAEARRLLNAPPALRVYRGHDLAGVELASALSGAYTIALAVADALKTSAGTRAVLLTRALAEMGRLVAAAGGDERTAWGLAGLGNLLVRSAPEEKRMSPAYRYGQKLAAGDVAGARLVEGARAALAGARLADRLGQRAPLLAGLAGVIDGRVAAADAARGIMAHVAEEE